MEYHDFLKIWDSVPKCRLFNDEWALSQLWLSVDTGVFPKPAEFGDVSCEMVPQLDRKPRADITHLKSPFHYLKILAQWSS